LGIPKAEKPQFQAQVGNTQKVIFPIFYQGLALRHQQNCRTAVGADGLSLLKNTPANPA
jgi:hypothetical protein